MLSPNSLRQQVFLYEFVPHHLCSVEPSSNAATTEDKEQTHGDHQGEGLECDDEGPKDAVDEGKADPRPL